MEWIDTTEGLARAVLATGIRPSAVSIAGKLSLAPSKDHGGGHGVRRLRRVPPSGKHPPRRYADPTSGSLAADPFS